MDHRVGDTQPELWLAFETVSDAIQGWAQRTPTATSLRFLKSGTTAEELTAAALNDRVDEVAKLLAQRLATGDRALLLFKPGLDFVVAFAGCLRAGIVAVPTMLPGPNEGIRRLTAIVENCNPSAALSHAEARFALDGHDIPCPIIEIDHPELSTHSDPIIPRKCDLALLQYTSGSTGTPKGVMIRHKNLMSNIDLLIRRFRVDQANSTVSWLPHYHDMGLIGPILTFLVAGRPAVLMAPNDFLREPLSWLKAISRYEASIITAPTFAFDLCARRLHETPSGLEDTALDLSHVRVAIVGAEMIRASTLARFASATASYGFSASAFFPCYGLAESTLFVDGVRGPLARVTRRFTGHALANGRVEVQAAHHAKANDKMLVASGTGAEQDDTLILVIKPDTSKIAPPSTVGEICVSSPSVAAGYWGRESENDAIFRAKIDGTAGREFLRTGDLGFIHDGLLFIAGRQDDLIILNGVNYYPHDIEESSSAAHPEVLGCRAAAVAVDVDEGSHLVIMQEMRRRKHTEAEQTSIVAAIRQAVYESCGIAVHDVVLVPPGKLPSTTSGKIRRRRCRDLYQSQELPSNWLRLPGSATRSAGSPIDAAPECPPELSLRLDAFRAVISEVLACPVSNIDIRLPITAQPLDSLKLVELMLLAEARLGWELSVEQLLGAESLIDLAKQSEDFIPVNAAQLSADAALPATIQPFNGPWAGQGDVVLTGATGMLGTRLLAELLMTSDRAIRCLVRGPERDALNRLTSHLGNIGFTQELVQQRVTCISVDLSKLKLGLTNRQYDTLATQADIVIHSAALLDFIRPYAALRPTNVEGTRAMINLAGTGRRKRLAHISSISVLETPLKAARHLDEHEPLDYPETLATAYAQTKWVSDVMVGRAKDRGFQASIFRVPWLLDMPYGGRPLPDGFLLRFFAGCVDLGCVPDTTARFNIVSAEFAAKAIVAIALGTAEGPLTYHLGAERGIDAVELRTILSTDGSDIAILAAEQWAERLDRRIREVKDYPLRPFAPLFLKNSGNPIQIEPYFTGRIPEMDSTATGQLLAREGLGKIPAASDVRRLVASVWASRQRGMPVRQQLLHAGDFG